MSKIIGIDLGTTNSCVCVLEGIDARGKPEIVVIPNTEGARTTPSVVAFTESGDRLVGQVAKRQATTNPARTITAVKRLMGQKVDSAEVMQHGKVATYDIVPDHNNDAWVSVKAGEKMSPPEVSSFILLAMKEIAETYLGEEVTQAIITVPAYFDDAQRQATKDAGRIAGLDVKRIINEPTAAALAYGLDSKGGTIVVYDLGGGTFDVSVLEISNGVFNVRATGGDTHLGGEDFDRLLIDKLAEDFKAQHQLDLRENRMSLQRLREAAERAKHELSSSLETEINIPFIATVGSGPVHLERSLKRSELEILVRPLVARTIVACKNTLKDANIEVKQIDEVVLVGGMTRMPAVQEAVKNFFERAPAKTVNPDEVVAYGAALQGAALGGDIDEVLLLDVTPLSIGVETGGGVFTKLIGRNTTIPTQKSEIFTTSVDNQNFVPIHVLQGEREMAADNRSLASFELSGIPPAPRGVPKIQVTFSINAEGLLSVEAIDQGTRRSQAVTVTPASGLSQQQVDDLVAQGEKFKDADHMRRNLAELRNQAETLIYTTEEALNAYGDLLDPERTAEVQIDIEQLRTMLSCGSSIDEIREAHAQLENAAYEIAEAMYGGTEG